VGAVDRRTEAGIDTGYLAVREPMNETGFPLSRTLEGSQMNRPIRIAIVGITSIIAASIAVRPTPGITALSYSGNVTGFFDSPVLSGAFLQLGTRLPVFGDNASTVTVSGNGTSSLAWSDNNVGTAAPSALTFAGNSFSAVATGQIFPLGTLTYFNGPNGPAALIFGVTMHLSAGDGITPFTAPAGIVSTQNGNVDRVADADSLFLGNLQVPSTLAAFEGAVVSAIIYGKMVGDGRLEVTSIALARGEAGHGCVDEAPPEESTSPCTSACGETCADITLALAERPCGSEPLPAVLSRRIGRSVDLLNQTTTTKNQRKVKIGVTQAMKQLRRSALIAGTAAKRGRISAACAEAVGKAIANAQTQAERWLSTR
jgi:hypothetical protein